MSQDYLPCVTILVKVPIVASVRRSKLKLVQSKKEILLGMYLKSSKACLKPGPNGFNKIQSCSFHSCFFFPVVFILGSFLHYGGKAL